jgi:hypothetical protein
MSLVALSLPPKEPSSHPRPLPKTNASAKLRTNMLRLRIGCDSRNFVIIETL